MRIVPQHTVCPLMNSLAGSRDEYLADEAAAQTGRRPEFGYSKLVLLLGPSGVGKSLVISELALQNNRFEYVVPFTTRNLREGEKEKIHVSEAEMDLMEQRGELLVRNRIYGHEYATPRKPIEKMLRAGRCPCLDWPIERLHCLAPFFQNRLFLIYLAPPSLEVLKQRLQKDGRDPTGERWMKGRSEINALQRGDYTGIVDLLLVSRNQGCAQMAEKIRRHIFLSSLQRSSPTNNQLHRKEKP